MELNRFKQLLESTMGDAKPLIMEQTTASYTTTKWNQVTYKTVSARSTMGFKPGVKFEATKDPLIVTAKNVDVLQFSDYQWVSIGKNRVSFYCQQGKFYFEGGTHGYVDELKQLAPNLVKNVCGRTAVVTPKIPLVAPTPSDHVCDTDTTSIINKGTSYNYCKNGEKYYFVGTTGNFKTKHPKWTEATGKGLDSIKKMMTNYTEWENDRK